MASSPPTTTTPWGGGGRVDDAASTTTTTGPTPATGFAPDGSVGATGRDGTGPRDVDVDVDNVVVHGEGSADGIVVGDDDDTGSTYSTATSNPTWDPTWSPTEYPTGYPTWHYTDPPSSDGRRRRQPYCPPAYDLAKTDYVTGERVEVGGYVFECRRSSGDDDEDEDDDVDYVRYCNMPDPSELTTDDEFRDWTDSWVEVSACYTTMSPTRSPSAGPATAAPSG